MKIGQPKLSETFGQKLQEEDRMAGLVVSNHIELAIYRISIYNKMDDQEFSW